MGHEPWCDPKGETEAAGGPTAMETVGLEDQEQLKGRPSTTTLNPPVQPRSILHARPRAQEARGDL